MQKKTYDKDYTDIFTDLLLSNSKNEIIVSIINKTLSSCSEKSYERVESILNYIVNQDYIDIKKECYYGLPDDLLCLRSLIWCLNLNYLPRDPYKWKETLINKRNEYNIIKEALQERLNAESKIYENYKNNDNILNKKEEYEHLKKITDKNLLEIIDKDINRTHSTICFFSKPLDEYSFNSNEDFTKAINRKRNCLYNDPLMVYLKGFKDIKECNKTETHSDVMERILYIYSKLNKDINYIQGMNELLAPIYYCLANDLSFSETYSNVESDAFWCFSNLMDNVKYTFIQQYDNEYNGILTKVEIMMNIIQKINKKVYQSLIGKQVNLLQFAFKWFCIFYSQDFILPDVLRLWDTVFSEEDIYNFIYYFNLAIIQKHEKELINSDFSGIILIFQEIDGDDLETLIETAIKIKKSNEKKINNIINKIESKKRNNK